jgi:hypothetical protein
MQSQFSAAAAASISIVINQIDIEMSEAAGNIRMAVVPLYPPELGEQLPELRSPMTA